MTISYINEDTRSLCSSLTTYKGPFTKEEIREIRAHISDLKAAPCLADAPIEYSLMNTTVPSQNLKVKVGKVSIICSIVSSIQNPTEAQIERLKIQQIIRTDLQLPNRKFNDL